MTKEYLIMARITNMLKDKRSIPSKENEKDKGTSEKSAKIEQNKAFKDAYDLEEKQQKLAKLSQKISRSNHVPMQVLPVVKGWITLTFTIMTILKAQKIEQDLKAQKQAPAKLENEKEEVYQKNISNLEQEITKVSKNLPNQLKNHSEIKPHIANLLQEVAKLQPEITNTKQNAVFSEKSVPLHTFDQVKKQAITSSNQQTNQNHRSTITRTTDQSLTK